MKTSTLWEYNTPLSFESNCVCSTQAVMWRAVCRVSLQQGKRVGCNLINAQCRRTSSTLGCLGNRARTNFGSCYRGNGHIGLYHRHYSSGGVTVAAEPFLSGSSGSYVEAMYESWQRDRNSVHKV